MSNTKQKETSPPTLSTLIFPLNIHAFRIHDPRRCDSPLLRSRLFFASTFCLSLSSPSSSMLLLLQPDPWRLRWCDQGYSPNGDASTTSCCQTRHCPKTKRWHIHLRHSILIWDSRKARLGRDTRRRHTSRWTGGSTTGAAYPACHSACSSCEGAVWAGTRACGYGCVVHTRLAWDSGRDTGCRGWLRRGSCRCWTSYRDGCGSVPRADTRCSWDVDGSQLAWGECEG